MARQLRIEFAGAFNHITSRGNQKQPVFLSDRDRRYFLKLLGKANKKYGAVIHVYCLMNNHYHLLLETPHGNLSKVMHFINTAYTVYFNKQNDRVGHLFQGRYKAILIDADAYAQQVSLYIHLNPIRAGLVDLPEKYPWSSLKAYLGLDKGPPWLNTYFILKYYGVDIESAIEQYKILISGAVDKAPKNPFEGIEFSHILGREVFKERIYRTFINNIKEDRDLPRIRQVRQQLPIAKVQEAVNRVMGKQTKLAQRAAIFIVHMNTGYTLNEIGEYFGLSQSAIAQICHRMEEDLQRKMILNRTVKEIEKSLFLSNV